MEKGPLAESSPPKRAVGRATESPVGSLRDIVSTLPDTLTLEPSEDYGDGPDPVLLLLAGMAGGTAALLVAVVIILVMWIL